MSKTTYIQVDQSVKEKEKYDGNFARVGEFRSTFKRKLQKKNPLATYVADGLIEVDRTRFVYDIKTNANATAK